jgi:uncharacterized protein (DUF983 family)
MRVHGIEANFMRPIINKIRSSCPTCGQAGRFLSKYKNNKLTLICNDCNKTWVSLSGVCPVCGEANGYPADGVCRGCYEKRLGNGFK